MRGVEMAAAAGVRGYVLAGGRSSRMGTDKAEIVFRDETMLQRAVTTMAAVCGEVAVIGSRRPTPLPIEVRFIPDTFPGCGPMGGIEAALRDCLSASSEFSAFLPVDVPLLPAGLLRALVALWMRSSAMRIAAVVADGRLQPLVSLIHVDALPTLQAALERGDHRLQPALARAAGAMAAQQQVSEDAVFVRTSLMFGDRVVLTDGDAEMLWRPPESEWETRTGWFANLNTQEDLREARGEPGSSEQTGRSRPGAS